jgi:RimJ/RimL family protein N-acetyltransferase
MARINKEKLIRLIKFNKSYISKKYIQWLNDKNLMQYSDRRHKKHNKKSCIEYLKNFENSDDKFFAIIDKKNLEHIGNTTAIIDKKNNIADIGILIGKNNQGYGLIAWKEMISYLFSKKIRKVTGGAMINNKAMVKIFKKSNMQFEYKKKKQYLYKQNKPVDFIGYYKFNR